MEIHILDVGCGNMALIINPDNTKFVIDCNITEENKDNILQYVEGVFGAGIEIDGFINTHRDADHMRGIELLHDQHTINKIWDSDVPGTTIDTSEYNTYMRIRREVGTQLITPYTVHTWGDVRYRWMNGKIDDYSDVNQQSVVVKIEYKKPNCSILFTGDTDYRPWKEKILGRYNTADLKSTILIAPHHGSLTFFDDPLDEKNYYTEHIKKISPEITLVSVGPNNYGFPDKKSLELYEKYSSGSKNGNKIFRTDEKRNMKIILQDDGGWSLFTNNKI